MSTDLADSIQRIENQVLDSRLRFTLSEAAATTGLSLDETRDAMDRLLGRYICRVQVTDRPELIYDFGPSLRRLGKPSRGERARKVLAWLRRLFVVVFKLWITVTLITYFAVFALGMLTLMAAMLLGRGRGRGGGRGRPVDLSGLARLFASILSWRTHTFQVRRRTDRHGYPYRRYEPRPSPIDQKKKSFVAAVHDFVFGPERVVDPLVDERELAAYLRSQRGLLVASEIQALSGLPSWDAEVRFTETIARLEGYIRTSPGGVPYGQFDRLQGPPDEADSRAIRHYWDEYEPEYELNGNSRRNNLLVVAFNAVNLVVSLLVLGGSMAGWLEGTVGPVPASSSTGLLTLLGGWLPLVFSALFFLIPLGRLPGLLRRQRERRHNNLRKRIVKVIFRRRGAALSLDDMVAFVNQDNPEEPVTAGMIEPMLSELLIELGGQNPLADDGRLLYAFPRLALELQEVEKLRSARDAGSGPGRVVLDTGGEET